jgi:hypothetical protein
VLLKGRVSIFLSEILHIKLNMLTLLINHFLSEILHIKLHIKYVDFTNKSFDSRET